MRTFVRLALILTLAVSAWGENLSSATAAEIIDKSLKGTMVGVTLELGRVGTRCASEAADVYNYNPSKKIEFIAAEKAGVIKITPDGAEFWKVEPVDPKPPFVEAMKKVPHKVANGCDYQRFSFLVARKSIVDVARVNPLTEDTAEVEFSWRWVPTVPFAKLAEQLSPDQQKELEAYFSRIVPPQNDPHFSVSDIRSNAQPGYGKRTLKKSDNGWRLTD